MSSRIAISVVLTTIVAWLSISNHCALGALVAAQTNLAAAPMHCHDSQPAPSKKSGDEDIPCCKLLRATVTANVQTPVAGESGFAMPQELFITLLQSLDDQYLQLPEEIDTGPPFASSFAELILQRSLFAHAPPSFV